MSDLLKLVKGLNQSFNTVVIAGSAYAKNAEALKNIDAKKITILEPDSSAFSKLKASIDSQGTTHIHIKPASLSAGVTGKELFYHANAIGFSSNISPNKIKKLRPGLSFSKREVLHLDIASIADTLNIDSTLANLLILDTNGAESDLLKHLDVKLFSSIIIRTSIENLYGNRAPLIAIKKIYVKQNTPYLLVPEKLPPFVNCVVARPVGWHRSEYKVNSERLNAELKQIKNELEQERIRTLEISTKMEKTITVSQQTLNEQRDALAQSKDETIAITKKLESKNEEVQTLKAQLESNKKNYQAEMDSLKGGIASAEEENNKLQGVVCKLSEEQGEMKHKYETESQTLQAKLSEAINEKVGLQDLISDLNNERLELESKLKAEAQTLKAQLLELTKEKDELKNSVSNLSSLKLELQQNKETLQTQLQQLDKNNAELKTSIQTISDDNASLKKSLDESTKQSQEQSIALEESAKRETSLHKENIRIKSELKKMKSQFEQMTQTLSLNARLIARLEVDSDALRDVISEKNRKEVEFKELIVELHEKLQLASALYLQVKQHNPELLLNDV